MAILIIIIIIIIIESVNRILLLNYFFPFSLFFQSFLVEAIYHPEHLWKDKLNIESLHFPKYFSFLYLFTILLSVIESTVHYIIAIWS
ncbi:hypothetical protein Gasu2_15730 [Galdieria sulphuraria]|uniref:Uncharacterized protein n=1 Tax=Galdieria sulphuraria TaxID=130081 RepID=M2XS82_GALSU|nr:uncharacterized protein Gasu_58520 [Galdieria sulphuraria]EME26528.1 hypothetical protein Gasu_58520 [Galdieria sulphuraria]GJD07201.1 hypothetical protein Gasu2_15730 [Galdieria sulphuraria]|eukprot:XP_005703048.1 hypothetical protein Gasu_58520 [Galdieria sulphuraria]